MQNLRSSIYKKPSSHFGAFSNKCTKGKKLPLKSDTITYLFGFNGKEKIDEINGAGNDLDFGARIYDARLGRWLSLDPLMKKFPSLSQYCFVVNNPILVIDIDGRDVKGYITQNSNVYWGRGLKYISSSETFKSFVNQFASVNSDCGNSFMVRQSGRFSDVTLNYSTNNSMNDIGNTGLEFIVQNGERVLAENYVNTMGSVAGMNINILQKVVFFTINC